MSDNRGITVTIKYGKGYEETWAVFKGSANEVREDIAAYFGFPPEAMEGLTLSEVVVNATSLAHGKGNIAAMLGATIIPVSQSAVPAAPTGDPWAAAAQSAPASNWAPKASGPEPAAEDPNAWILGEIEKQPDRDSLKRLWAENQSFFADPAVMAAWKSKGKALAA
ncbi:hypothetical protein AB0D08_00360 [Kitasatospora sp. NPDC048540]|uniref:hypothetical protein n=1 Tax=Kitasatospora sp. NPDC048540 TaxID=3155634 RepID=UPI003406731A